MYYAGESLLELAVSLHEIELRMEFGNCARSKVGTSFKSIILCYSDSEYNIDIYIFLIQIAYSVIVENGMGFWRGLQLERIWSFDCPKRQTHYIDCVLFISVYYNQLIIYRR